jgi:topoisomerase-4 subunit B
MPGVTVTLANEKTGETQTWQYKGGLRDYLNQTLSGRPGDPAVRRRAVRRRRRAENFAEGEGAAWCVAFTEDGAPLRESYVNLIPTVAGGTHEAACATAVPGRQGLHRAAQRCCPRASS